MLGGRGYVFCLGSHKAKIKEYSLLETLGGESTSKLIQVVGQTQFLVVVGLRSPFPCWLSAGTGLCY